MRLHWLLIGSLVASGLAVSPAQAGGRLTSWQFNKNQNRLTFRTAEAVQPRAQLFSDPTRVVIDLPRTSRGDALRNQMIGGKIKEVRVVQLNKSTTRLVVELEEGYTLNPNQIRVQGKNPQHWSVQLPPPQRQQQREVAQTTNSSPRSGGQSGSEVSHPNFRVTGSGFFLGLDNPPSREIEVERSEDRKRVLIRLPNASLPADLPRVIPVNNYGVSYAQFDSVENGSEIVLHVSEDSPNWQAFPNTSGNGGVAMLPDGGMTAAQQLSTPSAPQWVEDGMNESKITKVEAFDLVNNQLLVRGDGTLTATGKWDQTSGIYEITILNAELSDPVRGPELERNSPISQIHVRQEDDDRVVVEVQAASGVQIEDQINQPSENLLAIGWRQGQTAGGRSPRAASDYYDREHFKNKLRNKGIPLFIKRVSGSVNSVGGIEPYFLLQNLSNKTIKYIKIMVVGYNSVGDIASDDWGNKKHWVRLVGPVKSNEKPLYSFEDDPIFYNKTTSCLEVQHVEVEFMDGSTYTMINDLKTARYRESNYNIKGDCSYNNSKSSNQNNNTQDKDFVRLHADDPDSGGA